MTKLSEIFGDNSDAGGVKTVSTFPYTLLSGDDRYIIEITGANSGYIYAPTGLSAGWQVAIVYAGTDDVLLTCATGVTIYHTDGVADTEETHNFSFPDLTRWTTVTLYSRGSNEFVLIGPVAYSGGPV